MMALGLIRGPLLSGNAIVNFEQERWAEAIAVHRIYGEKAGEHVAERIGALALNGDQVGIDRWMAIARRLDQLLAGALQ